MVVVLVHGTIPYIGRFRLSARPTWHKPESDFCATLKTGLPPQTTFESFDWSGKNSHKARLEAAQSLAQKLERSLENRPNERHFIIAHSHGGNVALYGCRYLNWKTSKEIEGVACLATPFFHGMSRDIAELRTILGHSLFFSLILLVFLLIVYASLPNRVFWGVIFHLQYFNLVLGEINLAGYAIFCFVVIALSLWNWGILPALVKEWMLKAVVMATVLRADSKNTLRLFIARGKRDEAYHWLRILEFPSLISLEAAQSDIAALGLRIATRLQPSAEGIASNPFAFVSWGLLLGAIGGILSIVSIALSLVVNALTRSNPFGFGENIFLNWLVSVEPRIDPPNRVNAIFRDYKYGRLSFQHSFLYRDVRVLNDLTLWIRGELKQEDRIFSMFR